MEIDSYALRIYLRYVKLNKYTKATKKQAQVAMRHRLAAKAKSSFTV